MPLTVISEINTIDDAGLTLKWADGTHSLFYAIWLRDNAHGPASRHPENDQRLFDMSELPDEITL